MNTAHPISINDARHLQKVGNTGLKLQKKMHFWGWEQAEKYYVYVSILFFPDLFTRK